jgi:hypothetical protein
VRYAHPFAVSRARLLSVAGYSVTRIAWNPLEDEREAIAADLRALLYKRP